MLIRRNFSHIHRDSVETKLTRFQKFQRFCACNQKKRYPVRRREALIFRMKTCLNSWYRRHVSFKMYRLYFFLKKLGNQIFKKYLVNVSVIPFICLHVFHADFFFFREIAKLCLSLSRYTKEQEHCKLQDRHVKHTDELVF